MQTILLLLIFPLLVFSIIYLPPPEGSIDPRPVLAPWKGFPKSNHSLSNSNHSLFNASHTLFNASHTLFNASHTPIFDHRTSLQHYESVSVPKDNWVTCYHGPYNGTDVHNTSTSYVQEFRLKGKGQNETQLGRYGGYTLWQNFPCNVPRYNFHLVQDPEERKEWEWEAKGYMIFHQNGTKVDKKCLNEAISILMGFVDKVTIWQRVFGYPPPGTVGAKPYTPPSLLDKIFHSPKHVPCYGDDVDGDRY